jgi:predicted tellurium resistance membrane protein TerC
MRRRRYTPGRMEWLTDPQIWISLVTLTALEIVLGIDNIVFIAILTGKLPVAQQARARTIGLSLAMGMRIALLLTISWVIGLTAPLFTLVGIEFSGRDLILIGGGLFLIAKATFEIHEMLEGHEPSRAVGAKTVTFGAVLVQIVLLDAVFSLDSVITAVGMADEIGVMIAAVVIAILVMLVSAGAIAGFVARHPTVKMLALSFLLLIGMSLLAEGFELHIPKGYIYAAMAFSVLVELLNLRIRGKGPTPVDLRPTYVKEPGAAITTPPPVNDPGARPTG